MQNKISHGELVLLYKDADVPSISGLAEKKMPQYSRDLAHGLLHARDAVSNETVTPGLPNARALGTGAKVKILRESDMGKREQGKALGWRDACSSSSSLRRDYRRRQQSTKRRSAWSTLRWLHEVGLQLHETNTIKERNVSIARALPIQQPIVALIRHFPCWSHAASDATSV